jgi:uncharacterized protein (DUF736 family)
MHVLELFSSVGVRYIGPSQKAPNIVVIAIFELVCVDNQTAIFPALALDVDLIGLYFGKSASRCLEKRGELRDAPLASPKLIKLAACRCGWVDLTLRLVSRSKSGASEDAITASAGVSATLERGREWGYSIAAVMMRPNDKSSEKESDYRITQQRLDGTVEFGAAWKRTGEGGREFLSIMLDDPSLPSPLNAVMFVADNGEGTRLVWQRPPKKAPAAEAKPDTPRPRYPQASRSPRDAFYP